MKGKNKHHRRIRDLDSEDELFGQSPSSSILMYDDNDHYGSSYASSMYAKDYREVAIKPRNANQERYFKLLEAPSPAIVVSYGPAGTGKTMIACHIGIRNLQQGIVSKLVLTRPAVSVEEQHGFLPGTLEEKMEPWLKPVFDVFYQYYSPPKVQNMIKQQVLEICPLAYMRGRTFENAWIIADESQNMTPNQMLMLLTRIGDGSKMVVTGDIRQHDRGYERNGLSDLLTRLRCGDPSPLDGAPLCEPIGSGMQDHENTHKASTDGATSKDRVTPSSGDGTPQGTPQIGVIEFTHKDVERHPVIKTILKLYADLKTSP